MIVSKSRMDYSHLVNDGNEEAELKSKEYEHYGLPFLQNYPGRDSCR